MVGVVNISFYAHMERNNPKIKTSSRVLGIPIDKRGDECVVHPSTKAGSAPAVSVGGKVVMHSRRAEVLSHS